MVHIGYCLSMSLEINSVFNVNVFQNINVQMHTQNVYEQD